MAKSKMLKEFAQNKIELESLLKQLKLLLVEGTFLNYHTQCSNVPIPLKPNSPEVVKECTSVLYH